MAKTPAASEQWTENTASRQIHLEQLRRAELFNGRAAMVGIVIGVVVIGAVHDFSALVASVRHGARSRAGWGARLESFAAPRVLLTSPLLS
jgi:hypothetical protein